MGEEKRGFFGRAAERARTASQERADAAAEASRLAQEHRQQLLAEGSLFEYTVVSVRETLVGDKIRTDKLQELLNSYAGQGWRLKSVTSASVAGRVGPGGVEGLVLIFERRARA